MTDDEEARQTNALVAGNRWGMLGFSLTTLALAIGLIGGYVTIILTPVNASISELKADVRDMNTTLAPLLTLYAQHKSDEGLFSSLQSQLDKKLEKEVFATSHDALEDRVSALISTNNAALAEISHQVHDLEAKIVSREENTVHWNATEALALRVNALSDRQCDAPQKTVK